MSRLFATLQAPLGSMVSIDRAWLAIATMLIAIALLASDRLAEFVLFTAGQLLRTAPFILFAVLLVAFLKASGAEATIARAFEGNETRMVVFAALLGGLAPFCSCEVIPFVAGLLAMGTPLSAVMAFWLASPLIDPPALLITAAALGWPFAVAKTVAAVGVGLFGGFVVKYAAAAGWFRDPLRATGPGGGRGCGPSPFGGRPVWRFWREGSRRAVFANEAWTNARFLLKWLTLAYLLEGMMIAYVPAEAIAGLVGGDGVSAIMLGALLGAPAYLNSYAAPALVAGLIEQGMSAGASMAFLVAGAVSSIPAMTAVFALVKRRVFAAYVLLGFTGAVLSGVVFGALMAP